MALKMAVAVALSTLIAVLVVTAAPADTAPDLCAAGVTTNATGPRSSVLPART